VKTSIPGCQKQTKTGLMQRGHQTSSASYPVFHRRRILQCLPSAQITMDGFSLHYSTSYDAFELILCVTSIHYVKLIPNLLGRTLSHAISATVPAGDLTCSAGVHVSCACRCACVMVPNARRTDLVVVARRVTGENILIRA